MTNFKVSSLTLPQPPLFCIDFSAINSDIKQTCFNLLIEDDKVSHSRSLAGNLEHQYLAPQVIKDHIKPYIFHVLQNIVSDTVEIVLTSCWVNFQKKYEFNPNHNHSGDYSFVWWIHIPYDIQEELSLDFVKNSKNPSASMFYFTYSDLTGKLNYYPIPVEKKDEGTLVLFPSNLTHTVYPFYTSDDYRISISGNLSFKK